MIKNTKSQNHKTPPPAQRAFYRRHRGFLLPESDHFSSKVMASSSFLTTKRKINKIDIVLTAHHYNDQIETLLMKKNAKSDWISSLGIREEYGIIKRPLLKIRKSQILRYAKKNNLKWCDDISNLNLKFILIWI